ncbi:MAG TPA: acyloxyacyl hydrolase [Chthoniobacterales bacterium]
MPRLDQSVVELSAAYQFKIASPNAANGYRVLNGMFTYKSRGGFQRNLFGGKFGVRNTATLLAEPILKGVESYYIGVAFRPSLEWWPENERYYLFISPGGGFGWTDSHGVEGGQGQDFTLNILVDAGVGFFLNQTTAVKIGIQYQHFSNSGMSDPNPGLNTVGPEIGVSVFF